MIWWQILLACLVSYLIGNISIARFLASLKKQDVTKIGSGNPGTTNILRKFGFKMGLINFILDISKGFIPSIIAFNIFEQSYVALFACGLSVILGHIYPVFFKFKGGKGIASMLGVFLASNPLITLIVIAFAAISWLLFEYGSVASFLCVTALTVIEGIRAKCLPDEESRVVCILLFCIFLFTWFAHRGNIERLLFGRENRVSLIRKTNKLLKNNKKESNTIITKNNNK